MKKNELKNWLKQYIKDHPDNAVSGEQADNKVCAGLKFYEEPLVGFASAKDPLFDEYKKTDVVGPWYKGPNEWLPEAKTVVSVFFPFSKEIRESNRGDISETSAEWLYGRIEGQVFINQVMKEVQSFLEEKHVKICIPSIDPGFLSNSGGKGIAGYEDVSEGVFASNWSERHTAFACGLGTFGLSKGIITEKGMAGRFASLIIDCEMEPDVRPYTDIYEYCSKCGACIRRCPAEAISLEEGKKHVPCGAWMKQSKVKYAPRYGCGKCQVNVPCEDRIPGRKA